MYVPFSSDMDLDAEANSILTKMRRSYVWTLTILTVGTDFFRVYSPFRNSPLFTQYVYT